MDIRIEPNQRFGHGYQIRVLGDPAREVYDDEPLTFSEAMEAIQETMDGMNAETGTGFTLSKVRAWPADSPAGENGPDMVAYKPGPDGWEQVEGGKNHPVVSARDVVLLAWAAWKKSGSEQSKNAVRRYCEYISAQGYRVGPSKAMAELGAMSFNRGAKWIKKTFAKYVQDRTAVMRCVMPQT